MKITSIKIHKGKIYEVVFDSERTFYLHVDTIFDFGLKNGAEIERDLLKKIIYASNFRRAYEYSLYCLDYRDYSADELFRKITEKYKSERLCADVIKKLTEADIINDRRFAEKLALKLVGAKKYGFRRAKREIVLKGISEDIAREVLGEFEESFFPNLTELLEKKYSRYLTDRNDRKSVEKVKNALVRYGYDFESINRAVKEYFDNKEKTEG